jgi:hypothetical protein
MTPMNLAPIIPIRRPEPLDDPAWATELKLDGFRGLADTINGRMLSKNLNPLKRFQHLLDALPFDCIFDGEICVLHSDGRPRFNDRYSGEDSPYMWCSTYFAMNARTSAPSRIVSREQVRPPENLTEALGNLCMLFAGALGDDDIRLFKYKAKRSPRSPIECSSVIVHWHWLPT